ncbi:MAG: hypothetical protein ACFBSF_05380 [Leptolyngbyaceae cyanobacterium]
MALALTIWELPAGDRFNAGAATSALYFVRGCDPFAIAHPTMTKYVVIVCLLEAELPLTELFWLEVGNFTGHHNSFALNPFH